MHATTQHQDSFGSAQHFDLERALTRLRYNERLLFQLIEFFLEDQAKLVGEIRTGVAQRNGPQIRRAAHTLKGMAANFNADSVVQAALEIEMSARTNEIDAVSQQLDVLEGRIDSLVAQLGPLVNPNVADS